MFPPELTAHFEEHMRELSTELSMSHVTTEESTVVTQDDPLEKLESLFGTIKPKYYHVDEWQLDEANYKIGENSQATKKKILFLDVLLN